jgi:hypothetical protein
MPRLMSRLVARILLSIFLFPLAGIVYLVSFMFADRLWRHGIYGRAYDAWLFVGSGSVTWLFVAGYWVLLWRSNIRWDSRRIIGTLLAAFAAAGAGLFAGLVMGTVLPSYSGWTFGAFVGSMVAIVLWLVATVIIWRDTPAERSQRARASGRSAVVCPTCGYNLTGLSESRCPECGSKFTIDELIGLQPGVEAEIE